MCRPAPSSRRISDDVGRNRLPPFPPTRKPKLPRGVRLTHNEAQGGWVLLAPERVFKADAIAVEILQRCTGEATFGAIVDDLASTFHAPRERIEADVATLMRSLADKKLLELWVMIMLERIYPLVPASRSAQSAAEAELLGVDPEVRKHWSPAFAGISGKRVGFLHSHAAVVMDRAAPQFPAASRSSCRVDPSLSARLSLLLWSARAGCSEGRARHATWVRVIREAAALGVLQVHLSGGEPASRRDLAGDHQTGPRGGPLHQSHHVGIGLTEQGARCARRWRARSCAGVHPGRAKRRLPIQSRVLRENLRKKARSGRGRLRSAKLPLTVNAVMHRANIKQDRRDGRSRAHTWKRAGSRSRMCNTTDGR